MIDPEKWKMACERAGLEICAVCDAAMHQKYDLGRDANIISTHIYQPPIGDPATVLAMLTTCKVSLVPPNQMLGWPSWRASCPGEGKYYGDTPAEAIVNAIAGLCASK